MVFSAEQEEVLRSLSSGIKYWSQSAERQEIIRYLDSHGLCTPREDLRPGYYFLTQKGKSALAELEKQAAEQKQREEEKASAKAELHNERIINRAEKKRDRKSNNRTTILAAIITAIITFALSNIKEIIAFISSLFH